MSKLAEHADLLCPKIRLVVHKDRVSQVEISKGKVAIRDLLSVYQCQKINVQP